MTDDSDAVRVSPLLHEDTRSSFRVEEVDLTPFPNTNALGKHMTHRSDNDDLEEPQYRALDDDPLPIMFSQFNGDSSALVKRWSGSRATGNMTTGVFNLTNTMIGSGIIGLPHALYQAGFAAGIVLLVFVAVVFDFSLRLLIDTGMNVGRFDYEELMSHCFGSRGFHLTLFFIFILDVGAMISYVVVVGDTVPPVLIFLFGGEGTVWTHRVFVCFVFCSIVTLPAVFLRTLKSLSFVSVVSTVVIAAVTFIVATSGIIDPDPNIRPAHREIEVINGQIFSALGTMAFVYECQDVCFQVFQSIKNPSRERWSTTVHVSMVISCCVSVGFAVIGYLSFYQFTKSNILDNFRVDDRLVNAARVMVAATVMLAFPMSFFMTRHVLARVLFQYKSSDEFSTPVFVALSLFLFYAVVTSGAFIKDLGVVQSLSGGLSAVALAFILPAACAIKVSYSRGDAVISCKNVKILVLFAFGCVAMTACVTQTVYELT